MIFKEGTVLILGAGASAPYGFPTGKGLREKILKLTEYSLISNLNTNEVGLQSNHTAKFKDAFGENKISDFRKILTQSVKETIDAFLEARKSYRDIGSYAIAHVLLHTEDESNLFPHKDWYKTLFEELDLLNPNSQPPIKAIITFNYDRSLEHYLYTCVDSTWENEDRDFALQKLKSIHIIHLHGSLGDYPEVPYTVDPDPEAIKSAMTKIALVHDDFDHTQQLFNAQLIINGATEIIFLGFGYDHRSLKRLRFITDERLQNPFKPQKSIWGTTKNYPDRDKLTFIPNREDRLDKHGLDCFGYLSHIVRTREAEDFKNQTGVRIDGEYHENHSGGGNGVKLD
jgi:hypothetical protein